MTALLMRWQVIPANFILFCYRSNFYHPSGPYATEGKIIIIIIIIIIIDILQIGKHTHLLPICHIDSWYMAVKLFFKKTVDNRLWFVLAPTSMLVITGDCIDTDATLQN